MKPEDLIADLRDIHLPPLERELAISGFASWPLLLFAAIVVFCIFQYWWRRNYWKRQVRNELVAIEKSAREGESVFAWRQLASLIRRIAIKVTSDSHVAGQAGERWLHDLDSLFQTTEFAQGCGRGLIHYPYVERSDPEVEEVLTVIGIVRSRIGRMKAAR